jgi:hypothetical protein
LFWIGRYAGAVQRGDKDVRADLVVAESFELGGPNGKLAALLRANDRGGGVLSFLDDEQRSRLDVGMSPGGDPALTIYATKGRPRVRLTVKGETARLSLLGGPLSPAIDLTIGPQNAPSITISDAARGTISLKLNDQGEPAISLEGGRDRPSQKLTADKARTGISFLARNGGERASWTLLDDGSPQITFWDDRVKQTILVGAPASAPVLSLVGRSVLQTTSWRMLADGTPALTISDERGNARLVVTLDEDGKPCFFSEVPGKAK